MAGGSLEDCTGGEADWLHFIGVDGKVGSQVVGLGMFVGGRFDTNLHALDLVSNGLTVTAALHLAALAVETLDFVPGRNEDIVIDLAHSNSEVNELDGDNILPLDAIGSGSSSIAAKDGRSNSGGLDGRSLEDGTGGRAEVHGWDC